MECDADFIEERTMIPLFRAPRGKQVSLVLRFPTQQGGGGAGGGRQQGGISIGFFDPKNSANIGQKTSPKCHLKKDT